MKINLRQLPLLLLTFCLPWSLHVQAERDVFSSQNKAWKEKYEKLVPVKVTSHSGLPDQYGRFGHSWIAAKIKGRLSSSEESGR